MDILEGIAQSFTVEQRREYKDLEFKIEQVTGIILAEKKSIDSNFVRLSQYIEEVRRKKYWLLGSYRTFGDYVEDIGKKFDIGHSQLYLGMRVTRNLLPTIPENDIVEIGITKASVLSKYVEQSGQQNIPQEILDVAKDPTKDREDLDAAVNAKLHNIMPAKGTWLNLGGFFVDEDERLEIQQSLEIAGSIDPVVPNSIPEWQQRKEKILRLCREFSSTYAGSK